jgi:hypothetical protein
MVDNCPKIETIKVATVRQFVLVGIVLRSLRQKNCLGAGAISSEKRSNVTTKKGSRKNFLRPASWPRSVWLESCCEKMMARVWLSNNNMIRKLASGKYRLYSRKIDPKTGKRRNLGTFDTRSGAEKHEHAVQYFKRHG